MPAPPGPSPKGRGSSLRLPNRFGETFAEADYDHFGDLVQLECDDETNLPDGRAKTTVLHDASRSIVSENNSPDIPFRFSLNPYRGCEHGCAYCYARPTHEYLGLNAGIDFESQIYVKEDAPRLFRNWLKRRETRSEAIAFSGVTDCYQPLERTHQLTRACLEVARDFGQPVSIVTKNALVLRDLDLLSGMARSGTVNVFMSINSLDAALARQMEPRTSSPAGRLKAIKTLRAAGVPAGVMVAPVIPGLNDSEIPAVLKSAREAGATSASYILLRLPLTVRPVFLEWLKRTQPNRASRVESLIRSTRDGELNDSNFGSRMRGSGEIADQIRQTFRLFARKYELDRQPDRVGVVAANRKSQAPSSEQLRLF